MARGVAIAAALLLCVSCGDGGRDLRIDRPTAGGIGLLERIVDALVPPMGTNLEHQDEVLADATPGQRAIYALWVTDLEVNNGGFEQFFFNEADTVLDEAIEGAERIGASANGRILRAADRVGDVPRAAAREETWSGYRNALPKSVRAELGTFDDRWFALDRQLERRMIAYVKANPGEFFR